VVWKETFFGSWRYASLIHLLHVREGAGFPFSIAGFEDSIQLPASVSARISFSQDFHYRLVAGKSTLPFASLVAVRAQFGPKQLESGRFGSANAFVVDTVPNQA
jgi:hypothetical protein